MNEQLIAQLQLLIELAMTGEEFEERNNIVKYRFKDNQLQRCFISDDGCWDMSGIWFNDAITDIIRKPWKPKVGEKYWRWHTGLHEEVGAILDRFDGFHADYLNFSIGNCFRTKEECESHTEVRDKLIAMRKEYE